MAYIYILVRGFKASENYMKVSWDYDYNIPNRWKVIKAMFQTTNQYIIIYIYILYSSLFCSPAEVLIQ